MSTIDLSRHATDFTKHYRGVRMQQGRVLTDDDFNEAARIEAEQARAALADVIGAVGSPDDGFRLKLDASNQLTLSAGTFYLGGHRIELEQDERFDTQRDWLTQGANSGEALEPKPDQERFDLIWIEAWLQPVSATEDKELFEVALGGGDTSARLRLMRRAHVLKDVGGADCPAAWQQLKTRLPGPGQVGTDFEWTTDATLKVEPTDDAGAADLCSSPVHGGYLGAENQAIRVQLIDSTHFTWGFDNAAPLYRVQLLTDPATGQRTRIHFLTQPKDQAHFPVEGQVIELLPWSALLSNGQKLGATSGHLAKVAQGYDPDSLELLIDAAPPPDQGTPALPFGSRWEQRGDKAAIRNEPAPESEYLYLRVWNRGADLASPAAIPFASGTAVPLAQTGLKVTFYGTQLRPDDFWIVAVRPETPQTLVPWSLGQGRPPHGIRRWVAPLGIIRWDAKSPTPELVHDCRPSFLPLTRLRGCCTHTVGDGILSHGRFSSIQAAIDALGAEGGQVCVLPGTYHENVSIRLRHNVTVHGCGERSRVIGKDGAAVFTVVASMDIRIEDLAIVAPKEQPGVLLPAAMVNPDLRPRLLPPNVGVALVGLHVQGFLRPAIEVRAGLDLLIRRCHVVMADLASDFPAVFVSAHQALIEENSLITPAQTRPEAPPAQEPPQPGPSTDIPTPGPAPLDSRILRSPAHFLRPRQEWLWDALTTVSRAASTPPVAPSAAAQVARLDDPADWPIAHEGRGGLQLGGGCQHVRVRDNLILGGIGHGIVLGSLRMSDDSPGTSDRTIIRFTEAECDGCIPGTIVIRKPKPDDKAYPVSSGPLFDIRIQGNRIYRMGLCGIGVVGYLRLEGEGRQLVSVQDLWIDGNVIQRCLARPVADLPDDGLLPAAYAAISLAEVTSLVVHDNHLLDNGLVEADAPICGIFVVHAEGLDISRNRILNNGFNPLRLPPAQNPDAPNYIHGFFKAPPPAPLKRGPRGGIYIDFASAPKAAAWNTSPGARERGGEPAARIHDNIVSTPIGRALHIGAFGPVSVEGNQFTTYGALPGLESPTCLGAAVFILGFGDFPEQLPDLSRIFWTRGIGQSPSVANNTAVPPIMDLRLFVGGEILFNDNQVVLDLLDPAVPSPASDQNQDQRKSPTSALVLSSVYICCPDDIGFSDNQCSCRLYRNRDGSNDFVFAHISLDAFSVRMQGNRVKEGITNAFFSGVTVGKTFNNTSHNQGTHCFLVLGPPQWKVADSNRVLTQPNPDFCNRIGDSIQSPSPLH